MLILSRQKEESVVIGEGENKVTIKVIDIRDNRVRLGFSASPSIKIHRQEIFDKIVQK